MIYNKADIPADLQQYFVRAEIGLEPTPNEFVAELVAVFREVRRVLRDDGTLWLNLGDSYNAAGRTGHGARVGYKQGTNRASAEGADNCRPSVKSLKEKDLIGIPWMLAFALRADGWYLRQDIIWAKPNPMPESIKDRCTKAHEYLFLLSKSPRYYFDADAIAEPLAPTSIARLSQPGLDEQVGSTRVPGKTNGTMKAVGSLRNSFARETKQSAGTHGQKPQHRADREPSDTTADGKRNKRSVWTVATQPFREAHFATFPPALVEPCILAGSSDRCCAQCAAPWIRKPTPTRPWWAGPTCRHDRRETVPTVVIDPFGGAGTTGLVADRLQRDAILIELNPEYAEIARRRINDDSPLFGAATS